MREGGRGRGKKENRGYIGEKIMEFINHANFLYCGNVRGTQFAFAEKH
jgi:hypothetical protein